MSAMGVTDWYTSHIRAHGRPPAQHELVLNKYPLAFVRESAQKLGAAFYLFVNRYRGNSEMSETAESMLPIVTRFDGIGAESLVAYKIGVHRSHQSIATWQTNLNGSVIIKRAAIIAAHDIMPEIDGEVWVDCGDGFQSYSTFQKYLENRPDSCNEFAILLCQCEGCQLGLLLSSSVSDQDGPLKLRKVGVFMTSGVWCLPSLAIEKDANWLVV